MADKPCSGIFARHYDVFAPQTVVRAHFPGIVSAIQRRLGKNVTVNCGYHTDGPFDADDPRRNTVIGIAYESAPAAEAHVEDGPSIAAHAVFNYLDRMTPVKFTAADGSRPCTLAVART